MAKSTQKIIAGHQGGVARAKALTQAERTAIARQGGRALWARIRTGQFRKASIKPAEK